MLCDDEMMAFLRSNTNSIKEFYKNRDLNVQKFPLKTMRRDIKSSDEPRLELLYSGSVFMNHLIDLFNFGLCDIESLNLSNLDI